MSSRERGSHQEGNRSEVQEACSEEKRVQVVTKSGVKQIHDRTSLGTKNWRWQNT